MTWRNPHATVRWDMTRSVLHGTDGGPYPIGKREAWLMFLDQRAQHLAASIPYTVSQEITHEPAESLDHADTYRAGESPDNAAVGSS